MASRVKRTFNLSPEAVARVRDLAGHGDLPRSQDGIVELAIDALYRQVSDGDDAAHWELAARDEAFVDEMRAVAADLAGVEAPPEA